MNLRVKIAPSTALVQGRLWGAAARDWAALQEPLHRPIWEAMLRSADIKPGSRLLDAGCGAGGAAILAAQMGVKVSGIDAASRLIDIACIQMPGGTFKVGGLEQLPFADRAFDAVISANAIQYTADPVATLREFARVIRPDGRIIVATWGKPEDCEVNAIIEAVHALLSDLPAAGVPADFSRRGALDTALSSAGLVMIDDHEVDCPFTYDSMETFWIAQRSSGTLQAAIKAVGESRVRAAAMTAATLFVTNNGSVRLSNRARYAVARIR